MSVDLFTKLSFDTGNQNVERVMDVETFYLRQNLEEN
jgi:hypothetical protein